MALPTEVGLKVLLSPLGSNAIIRTACCSVGVALPVYSTFKAIESKNRDEQQRWLLYWAAYGSFSIAEVFSDKILSWVPLYYHMKFAFLVWLQLPTTNGARHIYRRHLRPFLLKHQDRLDQVVEFLYGQTSKFISSHQGEIEFARELTKKIMGSARGLVYPGPRGQRLGNLAIQGPAEQVEDCASDVDD